MLGDMKNRVFQPPPEGDEQIIATFGEAKLVKVDGQIQLWGGSMADRMEAMEWVSLFLPDEAVNIK